MSLRLLVKKELLLLLRERMVILSIILPFIIYSSMGAALGSVSQQVGKAYRLKGVTVAVVPGSPAEKPVAEALATLMKEHGVRVVVAEGDPRSLLSRYQLVLYLPRGFAENLTAGKRAVLEVYVRGSLARLNVATVMPQGVAAFTSRLVQRGSLAMRVYVALGGRVYPLRELSQMFMTGSMLSFMSFFVIFPAASLAAVLVGSEKEERMFDIMLSLPVRRGDIAVAKMVAALVVGLLSAASAAAGFYFMLYSATGGSQPVRLVGYTPLHLGLYFVAVVLSALFAAAGALTLSLFAESVRGAQSLAMIVALPAFIVMFVAMMGVPLNPALYAVPYLCVVYAAMSPLAGVEPALYSIAAQLVETAAVAYIFARLLSGEAAVTAPARLKRLLERRRR